MTTTAERQHAEAVEQRYQKYAVKFVLDCGTDGSAPANAEPTDANLSLVLRNCSRRPSLEEYPAIRMHVDTYRMAQMSAAGAVRDVLLERAESYASDARKFADMAEHLPAFKTPEDCKRYATMYRTIADELRKVAAGL